MAEELVGRRVDDGNLVSFREAVKLFATKEELAGVGRGVDALVRDVGALVPRSEHEVRWRHDEEFERRIESRLDKTDERMTEVNDKLDALPGAILRSVAVVVGLIGALVAIVNALITSHKF